MKKTLLASLFLLSFASTTSANEYSHTFTAGYAKTNLNFNTLGTHPKGFNLKYHLQDSENPIGFISSFSYTKGEEDYLNGLVTQKLYYYSLLVGPSYTFADTFRVYAMGGVSRTGIRVSQPNAYDHERRTDFAYGLGLQYIISKSFVLDTSWEHTRYGNSRGKVETDTFTFGGGWQF
jgi:opacity protein-like surface antigen